MVPSREVEMQARRLLRRQGIGNPPVPVEEIARGLGIIVRREPFEGDVSGVLHRSGRVPVIGVNALDAAVRQRFTIAHEIGHLLLHDEPLYIDRHYLPPEKSLLSPSRRFLRDGVSSQASNPQEIQANRFAAALLMPRGFLDEDLKKMKIPLSALDVERLAKRYKVSQQAMILRLVNLGAPIQTA